MKKILIVLLPISLFVFSCEEEQGTIPPKVTIISHISGQSVYEIVTITVTTQDDEEISKVEFFIDDSLVLTDTESPYEYEWNTTQYENDSEHTVKVISYDNSENSTESQPIILRVDNTLSIPTPSVLYPITYDEGFQISWSQNNDDDFQTYKLYESLSENMYDDTLIYETNDKTDTTYLKTIKDIKYYKIVVEDSWGYQSISNIEFGDYYVELWGVVYSVRNTTELNLYNNDVTGPIPVEIGNLTNLTYLNIFNNDLIGSIPSEIGNLTNLTYLNLSENGLTGLIPMEIGNLTNLEELNLKDNQLTGSIPTEILNLTNLTYLSLHTNNLSGEIPTDLENLSKLEWFFLNDNNLTGSIPPETWNLTNLERLSLSGNQLTGFISPEIGNLTNLDRLYLSNNQLTGSIPPEIGNLTKLEFLYLSNNQFTGEISDNICDLNIEFINSGYDWDYFNIFNNQLCPPYPSCIEDYVGEQDTSNCD